MKSLLLMPAKNIDRSMLQQASAYQASLTKPAGSLGQLESIAESFCAWQSTLHPSLNHINVAVFAGDHGVVEQGVSAFPQAVTVQMITNFLEGGAAISVLSRDAGAHFSVVNMGVANPLPAAYSQHPQLITVALAKGTADFSVQAAMSEEHLNAALKAGYDYIHTENEQAPLDLFIGGEMGIGNTSSASAIYAAVLGLSAEQVVGPGTGLDAGGLRRKQEVIDTALKLHQEQLETPYDILRCLGGFEIAALVGAYIACAQQGIPALVDGFITTAAALLAVKINPGVREWLLFSHQSAEPAHALALHYLQTDALLNLGLRLGEGSGAALAVPLLRSALSLHNNMATFSDAGVSEKN